MGSFTDANLRAFAEETGIKPATGERAEILEALSQAAFAVIKVIELERSGVRDGDGFWYGSDAFGATLRYLVELYARLDAYDQRPGPFHRGPYPGGTEAANKATNVRPEGEAA
jgi:hypothetical protein